MWVAFAKYKGIDMPWRQVTVGGQQFSCNKGLMETALELAVVKYPDVEYKIEALT